MEFAHLALTISAHNLFFARSFHLLKTWFRLDIETSILCELVAKKEVSHHLWNWRNCWKNVSWFCFFLHLSFFEIGTEENSEKKKWSRKALAGRPLSLARNPWRTNSGNQITGACQPLFVTLRLSLSTFIYKVPLYADYADRFVDSQNNFLRGTCRPNEST